MYPRYYKVLDLNLVARQDSYLTGSIFRDGEWVYDDKHILSDRLIGYDGDVIGSSDMLFELEEITEQEALALTA